jgi:hypothetical protein
MRTGNINDQGSACFVDSQTMHGGLEINDLMVEQDVAIPSYSTKNNIQLNHLK